MEYYQCHSLKESFKQLDTTLKYPYKSRERSASRASSRSPGKARVGKAPCGPRWPRPGAPPDSRPWERWPGPPGSSKAAPEPGCPGGPIWQVGRASSELLRLDASAWRSVESEQGRSLLSSGLSWAPASPSSSGLHCKGARASTSVCRGGSTAPTGASWMGGRVGPECSASSPGLCL